jgi:hypothetical protein
MLERSRRRILDTLPDDAVVLDVGGWAKPLERADWVLDLLPYETRGLYGYDREAARPHERFSAERWVARDMCDHEPWPFADGQFDFAVCSHTLEDVRDPVWVCRELQRVAKAGYLEVPDRREEQCPGVHGPWVGWSHHRWLCDVRDDGIEFVGKPGLLSGRPELQVPYAAWAALDETSRVQELWWDGAFAVRERIFVSGAELDAYLAEVVPARAPVGRVRAALAQLRR